MKTLEKLFIKQCKRSERKHDKEGGNYDRKNRLFADRI